MNRIKLPFILVLVIAAGAGLYLSGAFSSGNTNASKKIPVNPVELSPTQPFELKLSDTNSDVYLRLKVALRPEPMTQQEYDLWTGAGGGGHHGGGGGPEPGPAAMAEYAPFRDAIITEVSKMTSEQLSSASGKEALKKQLQARFDEIADIDAAESATKAEEGEVHDPTHPPFRISQVLFTDFALG